MASYRKNNNGWRVEVYKKGRRASATFATKAQCKEWACGKECELSVEQGEGVYPDKTFGDAARRYLDEVSVNKKGYRWERVRINALQSEEMYSIKLSGLDASHMAQFRDMRLKSVTGATVNRELNLISAILSTARDEWKWLEKNPVGDIKRPRQPKHRERRIGTEEINKIGFALHYSEGAPIIMKTQLVGLFFMIALETAMRLGEIVAVNNNNALINLEKRYIKLVDTKNGDNRKVPLSRKATELIKVMADADLLITTESVSTLFRKATKACDIKDLTFHDSRHEALTRMARKVDVLDLAKISGHRDTRFLMVYYNPTSAEIADRLD